MAAQITTDAIVIALVSTSCNNIAYRYNSFGGTPKPYRIYRADLFSHLSSPRFKEKGGVNCSITIYSHPKSVVPDGQLVIEEPSANHQRYELNMKRALNIKNYMNHFPLLSIDVLSRLSAI